MTKCNNSIESKMTDEELFTILKNELIDGDDSLVDKYKKLKELRKLKCKIWDDLLNNFQDNYKRLFKIYKSGKGIKESGEYLTIGNFYINNINTELNRLNTKENIRLARVSIGFGLLSVILAIVTIVDPDAFKDFFTSKTPTKIESQMDSIHLSIEEIDNKIISLMEKSDTISIKIKEMKSDTLKNLSDKKCK